MTHNNDRNHHLEAIHQDLLTVLEASPINILIFDDQESIIYANSQARQHFGHRSVQPAVMRCGDFLSCVNRHIDLRGCGHTPACPDCAIFQARPSTQLSDKVLSVGEAFASRDGELIHSG